MNKTYQETFRVHSTKCDQFGRMRPDSLFLSMQEVGEHHANELGAGYQAMLSRGLFFALVRIHVSTVRAPRCDETIVHTTWPGVCNRFFCPRYHTFALEDGTPLAAAGALWVLLDVNDHKIVSPAKIDLGFPDTSDIPSPIALPNRLPAIGGAGQTFSRTPVYSDYDLNGHVNNTRYITWLSDALGTQALKDMYIGDLVAVYEKEIREERPLDLTLARDGDAFSFVVSSSGEKHFAAGGTLRKEP